MSRPGVATFTILLAVLSSLQAFAGTVRPGDAFSGRITGILAPGFYSVTADGDTARVAVSGIRCPSHGEDGREDAMIFAKQNVLGQEVRVEVRRVSTKGITTGEVQFVDGGDVAELLLANGHARWDSHSGTPLQEFEAKAREAQLGIWAVPSAQEDRSLEPPLLKIAGKRTGLTQHNPALQARQAYFSALKSARMSEIHARPQRFAAYQPDYTYASLPTPGSSGFSTRTGYSFTYHPPYYGDYWVLGSRHGYRYGYGWPLDILIISTPGYPRWHGHRHHARRPRPAPSRPSMTSVRSETPAPSPEREPLTHSPLAWTSR